MFDSLIKFIGSFGWLIYLNPFLAIVLVWNRQLAVLIDLVTSGQAVTKSIILNLVVILAAYILMSGATTFVSGVTCTGINYSLRQNYIQKISNENLPTQ